MIDKPYIDELSDFALVWQKLEQCDTRGIHIHDDDTGKLSYQSYATLVQQAGELAAYLASQGFKAGDKVLLSAKTTPEFPVLWLALIWMGVTPVPLPPREMLVGKNTFKERLKGILKHFPYYICLENEVNDVRYAAKEQEANLTIITFSELLNRSNNNSVPTRAAIPNDTLAFIQFTSGSTSHPKGIMITYSNLYANIFAMWSRLSIDPSQEKILSWLPLYHDMGLVGKFLGALLTQTTLILTSSQYFARRPLHFMNLINQHQTQLCSMPNFGLEWILKRLATSKKPACSLASMKWIGVGAEPVNVKTLQSFEKAFAPFGLRPGVLSPCYGLAEATLAVSASPALAGYKVHTLDSYALPTLGFPLCNIQVKIDSDGDQSESGVIKIKGPSVARSAMINGQVKLLVDEDGYYNTGDIGAIANNQLQVLGRIDEMFILNGVNHFPYDIEATIRTIDGILRNRVACFQISDMSCRNSESGVIILFESKPLTDSEYTNLTIQIERRVLACSGFRPSAIVAVPPKSIPATPSGKLKRLSARRLYKEGYYSQETQLA
ncbi:Polyketide synthase modules and related proteins [hydrothermal vent metagenome]|uniref:Polyketide synthase modules and related proteins n=1 Tax=hydrothermal vent metagenome TaxID=652676 RepID=A0A3B0YPR6_9ZZZZ